MQATVCPYVDCGSANKNQSLAMDNENDNESTARYLPLYYNLGTEGVK